MVWWRGGAPKSVSPRYALGRRVRHDPRSRHYAIPESDTPIAAVNWVQRVPCFDQGDLGSCVGNAAAGWLVTDNSIRQGYTAAGGKPISETLAVALYSAATKLDGDPDNYPPTDTGSDGLAGAKALQIAGYCTSYAHAFSLNAMYAALQSGPVMVGTNWYNSMFDTATDGRIKFDTTSGVAGGHEYLVYRLDLDATGKPSRIWLRNSWGPSWGIDGCGYLTPANFALLLADQGDVTVPIAGPAPTPAPVPTPNPVPTPTPKPAAGTYTVTLDAKTWAKVVKNAPARKPSMSVEQYLLWLLQGALNTR